MQPEELPADGSTPGFVAMVGDMTQTYGATSHCEVTTYAAAKREQRFRPMRKTRQADAFRSTCLKFVNLDDHGSGVGYESSIPSLPLRKQKTRHDVPTNGVTLHAWNSLCMHRMQGVHDR